MLNNESQTEPLYRDNKREAMKQRFPFCRRSYCMEEHGRIQMTLESHLLDPASKSSCVI